MKLLFHFLTCLAFLYQFGDVWGQDLPPSHRSYNYRNDVYVNEVTTAAGGQGWVHKFEVPLTGDLTEIMNSGAAWYPSPGSSQLLNPHGLDVGLNGYLYIGDNPFDPYGIRHLTCDGGIIPKNEFAFTAVGHFFTNISSHDYPLDSNGYRSD